MRVNIEKIYKKNFISSWFLTLFNIQVRVLEQEIDSEQKKIIYLDSWDSDL